MALFRKFFYRKPSEGRFEISERVFVFDCCFGTNPPEGDDYNLYIRGVAARFIEYFHDATFVVFSFSNGDQQIQIVDLLTNYGMTIFNYPHQSENCQLLALETIHHFLKSSESWLSHGQRNLLLMHCQVNAMPVKMITLAALLVHHKQYKVEQKTLDMICKQASHDVLKLLSTATPLRYIQHKSRCDMGSQRLQALMLECIILREIPEMDGGEGCHLVFRICGQDPLMSSDSAMKVLFSVSRKSMRVRRLEQADSNSVRIDVCCQVRGDVVLECITLDDDNLGTGNMLLRVMFNTLFIRSNILALNREEIDISWSIKDQFPKNFSADVHFSEMSSSFLLAGLDSSCNEDATDFPVQEDTLVPNHVIGKMESGPNLVGDERVQKEVFSPKQQTSEGRFLEATPTTIETTPESEEFENAETLSDTSCENLTEKKIEFRQLQASVQRPSQCKIISPGISQTAVSNRTLYSSSLQGSLVALSRFHAAPALGITALLHDHEEYNLKEGSYDRIQESATSVTLSCEEKPVQPNSNEYENTREAPPPPPLLPPPPSPLFPPRRSSHMLPPIVHSLIQKPSLPSTLPAFPSSLPLELLSNGSSLQQPRLQTPTFTPVPPAPPPPPFQSKSYLTNPGLPKSQLEVPECVTPKLMMPHPPPLPPPCTSSFSSNGNSASVSQTSPSPCSGKTCTSSVESQTPLPHFRHLLTKDCKFHSGTESSTSSPDAIPHPSSNSNMSLPFRDTYSNIPPPSPPPPPLLGRAKSSSLLSATSKNPSHRILSSGANPSSRLLSGASVQPPLNSVQKESTVKGRQTGAPPPAPLPNGLSKPGTTGQCHSFEHDGDTPAPPTCAKVKMQMRTNTRFPSQNKKASLKPYHWLKLTRAIQGSLWAEAQNPEEALKAPELDMSELENLFSTSVQSSDLGGTDRTKNGRASGLKSDRVQLIELRRAYNCEIMLTKVKVPLSDLVNSVLALDDTSLGIDQIDNLIRFCPSKEEIELLKNYSGNKESLGKCERFFMELMRIPRVESKLRVFSFKIQFLSQVSDLRNSLNTVNSASVEVRNSVKLKRILQTILSLGNALNNGTARGSAIGFRLDSLQKLTETRSRNNKLTLMHYLCKVLAEKLPEVLDFQKDFSSLGAATKIQLKYLAEEMQAINKGLEKVAQELAASENDGPVSQNFCKTLKDFLCSAESEVKSLVSLYTGVGKNADALAFYFGEDPTRCPFEQVVSTLLNFTRMFNSAHNENCQHLEYEKKKAQKEAEKNDKAKLNAAAKDVGDV